MLELGVGKAGVDYKRGLALGQARAKRESMFHINNLPVVTVTQSARQFSYESLYPSNLTPSLKSTIIITHPVS
jgi:hypothetical protein